MIADFVELTKRLYVQLAEEEIRKTSTKINASRVSILTGLYRRDVRRLINCRGEPIKVESNLLSQVIGQWEGDRRFHAKKGGPRPLSYKGEKSEFYQLVRSLSSNINPATVLFELERNGAVEITPRGAKLIRSTEMVATDLDRILRYVASEIEALHQTTENNLGVVDGVGDLHIRTEYDNLYVSDLPEIRRWLVDKGREFHRQARVFLAPFDKDVNPRSDANSSAGGKVVLSAFSMTDPPPPKQDAESD